MASMRASETQERTLERLEQKRTHVASMRASETQEQTLERLEQNTTHIASMRASGTEFGEARAEENTHGKHETL